MPESDSRAGVKTSIEAYALPWPCTTRWTRTREPTPAASIHSVSAAVRGERRRWAPPRLVSGALEETGDEKETAKTGGMYRSSRIVTKSGRCCTLGVLPACAETS